MSMIHDIAGQLLVTAACAAVMVFGTGRIEQVLSRRAHHYGRPRTPNQPV